jgi:hypothetical protein
MLLHSDTLSWFRATQSFSLILRAYTEKQHMPILESLIWLAPMTYRIRYEHANHCTIDVDN